jgi:hypothetical protein
MAAAPAGAPFEEVAVGVPQLEQNLAPGARVAPHEAQPWLSGDPHCEQNFASAPFAVPQFEQTMEPGIALLAETAPRRVATASRSVTVGPGSGTPTGMRRPCDTVRASMRYGRSGQRPGLTTIPIQNPSLVTP